MCNLYRQYTSRVQPDRVLLTRTRYDTRLGTDPSSCNSLKPAFPTGTGQSDPDNKTCRPCKIKGCTVCTWDYSRCTQCPAYYGPAGSINDDGASNCKRCRSKSCGVCDNGFDAPCTGKVRSCSNKVKTTRSAKKVSVKDIVGDSTNARCWTNKQYFYGTYWVDASTLPHALTPSRSLTFVFARQWVLLADHIPD